MKWLSIAALALVAGCATTANRYGSYDYADEEAYYEVDQVIHGGRAGYSGYYGPGYALSHDPYWGYSGFVSYSNWPSYYVWTPYYDPFYAGSFGYAPVSYYRFYDPWYLRSHYYYGHHAHHGGHGRDDRFGRHDRGGRFGRGHGDDRFDSPRRNPGVSARNEARRLTTTRQPIFRKPPKTTGRDGDARRSPQRSSQGGSAPVPRSGSRPITVKSPDSVPIRTRALPERSSPRQPAVRAQTVARPVARPVSQPALRIPAAPRAKPARVNSPRVQAPPRVKAPPRSTPRVTPRSGSDERAPSRRKR